MNEKHELYVIDEEVVPEVLKKAYNAKMLLERNKEISVTEAVKREGISRSSFYKYKDMIKRYTPLNMNKIITVFMELSDAAGSLSEVLNVIARHGANVLTINQNIPINGKASISISIDTKNMKRSFESLEKKLKLIENVSNFMAFGNE